MANLPRFGRTWNRFSSLPRPATAGQPSYDADRTTTDPETRPSASAPTTHSLQPFEPNPPPKVSSLPSSPIREPSRISSPVKKVASPYSSPKYHPTAARVVSPPAASTKPAASSSSPTYQHYDGVRRVSPTSSPKTVKHTQTFSPPSPKHRQPSAPLSPLTLPRSGVKSTFGTTERSRSPPEVEKKSVLYQKPTENVQAAKYDRSEEHGHGSGKTHQKKPQPDVIKLTGENVGAVMHINQSHENAEIVRKKASEEERIIGYENGERKSEKGKNKLSSSPEKIFLNSNFQGVNNSLLYNSSCNHRDPGLHLAFSGKPKGKDETDSISKRNYSN